MELVTDEFGAKNYNKKNRINMTIPEEFDRANKQRKISNEINWRIPKSDNYDSKKLKLGLSDEAGQWKQPTILKAVSPCAYFNPIVGITSITKCICGFEKFEH